MSELPDNFIQEYFKPQRTPALPEEGHDRLYCGMDGRMRILHHDGSEEIIEAK